MQRCLAFSLWFCWLTCTAGATTRVAVLAQAGTTADKLSSLLEVTLANDKTLQLADRSQFNAVLNEQQLAACFQADAFSARLKLGHLVDTDVLVVLREVAEPTNHIELAVIDSRRGARLLVEPSPISRDTDADVGRINHSVITALAKLNEGITALVAVPDFVCDDLTRGHADDGDSYASLVEQSLVNRRGVFVVEIAEAQAIAREQAIAGQSVLDRPLPYILLGSFRDNDSGSRRSIDIRLRLDKGGDRVAERSASRINPSDIARLLLTESDKLTATIFTRPSVAPDPDGDARQLQSRAANFLELGEFRRSLCLCEASLLLRPLPEAHRDAADAALELCIAQRNPTDTNRSPKRHVESVLEFPATCQPLLDRGLAHAEAYMKATRLSYLSPRDRVIQRYRLNCPAEPMAEMLLRVAQTKYDTDIKDDTLQFASNLKWSAIAPPALRYQLLTRLALLAQQPSDTARIEKMFSGDRTDSAERSTAIGTLAGSTNPFARNAVTGLKATRSASVAVDTPPPSPTTRPSIPTTQQVVTLVPINIGLDPVWGCVPAGQRLDLLWGMTGRDTLPVVGMIDQLGSFRTLCKSIRGSTPVFDGQWIWTAGDGSGGPQILCCDPTTGDRTVIEPADGLPDESICGFAAAPLSSGRICAAIGIGTPTQFRSYLALLTRDGHAHNRVVILHEEKLSVMAPGVDRFDPQVAFMPLNADVLLADRPNSATGMTVAFTGGFGRRLVRFPDAESLRTGRGAVVTTSLQLPGTCVSEGAVFETRLRSASQINADLLRSTLDGKNAEVINHSAVPGPMSITRTGVYIFCPADASLYFALTPRQPFRQCRTNLPTGYVNDPGTVICQSNRFGLLLRNAGTLLQFQDSTGRAIKIFQP